MVKDDKNEVVLSGDAALIWKDIQNVDLGLFALPNQLVKNHCFPQIIEPSKLYLKQSSTAVLPALEDAIGKKYNIELSDLFVIVSKKV